MIFSTNDIHSYFYFLSSKTFVILVKNILQKYLQCKGSNNFTDRIHLKKKKKSLRQNSENIHAFRETQLKITLAINQRKQFVSSSQQRERRSSLSPFFTGNVRNSARIPRSRGEKNKGEEGGRETPAFGPVTSVSRLRTENGSASVQPLKRWEFCVTRGQRADERRERGRAASAVTAVTPVILLYAGNKCAPLTHASAIPAFSSILVRPRAHLYLFPRRVPRDG